MDIAIFSLASLYLGQGAWLLMAASNNFIDRNTNTILLHRIFSMEDIREGNVLGKKLLSRAILSTDVVKSILGIGIVFEYAIALALLLSFVLLVSEAFGVTIVSRHTIIIFSGLSLVSHMLLWFAFLIKGLWFAYWIKLGEVQSVHFTLLIISILALIFFNLVFMQVG